MTERLQPRAAAKGWGSQMGIYNGVQNSGCPGNIRNIYKRRLTGIGSHDDEALKQGAAKRRAPRRDL